MRDILSERKILTNPAIHHYVWPAMDTCCVPSNQNEPGEIPMNIEQEIANAYVLPLCAFPQARTSPSHAAILKLCADAKNKGHIWAESALGEISLIMGVDYEFSRSTSLDSEIHSVVIRP